MQQQLTAEVICRVFASREILISKKMKVKDIKIVLVFNLHFRMALRNLNYWYSSYPKTLIEEWEIPISLIENNFWKIKRNAAGNCACFWTKNLLGYAKNNSENKSQNFVRFSSMKSTN